MAWIKRNLYFLIGSVVALALMGLAGWYLYSKWELNNYYLEELNKQYTELNRINALNPHPGNPPKTDNAKLAREQQQQLLAFKDKTRKYFQRIPPIPDTPKPTSQEFAAALSRTVAQLQKDATNASVALQKPNYSFSFEAQRALLSFAPGSLESLAVQLGEVRAICDVLFEAKINALDDLKRERVSADDSAGQQTDYLSDRSVTNELAAKEAAVLSPYELRFRCFSPELAAVLTGLAGSPYGLMVKSLNVELAPAAPEAPPAPVILMPAPGYPAATPTPERRSSESDEFMQRYGLGPYARRRATPPPQPAPVYSAPAAVAPGTTPPGSRPGAQAALDEKQLQVTLTLVVVKLASLK